MERWIKGAFALLLFIVLPTLAARYQYFPDSYVVGSIQVVKVQKGDTLTKIARRYDVAPTKMIEANPKARDQYLQIGQMVIVPSRFVLLSYHEGIVINLAELRLYYFPPHTNIVYTYPIAVGRVGWRTPTTVTSVYKKEKDPVWRVPKSIWQYTYRTKGIKLPAVVGPGPDNPLGPYALYLKLSGYLIHGTNDPDSIGKYVSSGCIRLYPADITQLYSLVDIGTVVHIIHHANKADWHHDELYLESHRSMEEMNNKTELNHQPAEEAIQEATANKKATVNWPQVNQAQKNKLGIPVTVGK